MEKIKEYITKNKKIVIPVVIIIILLLIGGIYITYSNNNDPKTDHNSKQETTKKDLTTYVKGLSDLTIEVNAKDIDFLKNITFDKKEIKDITVDSSKVDLTKEGEYNLIYSIVPLDKTMTTMNITKTVKVISAKKAQEEANEGNEVITSNNEVKKESNEKDSKPKQETATDNNSVNKDSSNSGSSANKSKVGKNESQNGGNFSNNSGKNSSSNNTIITPKPEQPKETEKPVHVHDFSIYVPEKSHTETGTETYTEQVPKYKTIGWYECNHCHTSSEDEMKIATHCEDVCGCGWTYYTKDVPNGTEIVTKTRPTSKKVVDDPAHYECSCGARQ